jgi:hypothetical protein
MNIAAVMAALEVWDLDRNAKMALLVIACRADRHTGMAEVGVPRVAADMKVGYYAAAHALDRVVKTGYLTVDKSPGRTAIWQLTAAVKTAAVFDGDHRDSEHQPPRYHRDSEHRPPRSRPRTKDSKEKDMKERAAASLAPGASGGAGENPPSRGEHFAPGSGYLEDFTGLAAHLRLVDDE